MTKYQAMQQNPNDDYHIRTQNGRITIGVRADGNMVITQDASGGIVVTPEEAERLGKLIFAKRKSILGTTQANSPKVTPPSFTSPQTCITSHISELKAKHVNAYEKWSDAEINRLRQYHQEGKTTLEIAELLGRNEGAINSKLRKLNLI